MLTPPGSRGQVDGGIRIGRRVLHRRTKGHACKLVQGREPAARSCPFLITCRLKCLEFSGAGLGWLLLVVVGCCCCCWGGSVSNHRCMPVQFLTLLVVLAQSTDFPQLAFATGLTLTFGQCPSYSSTLPLMPSSWTDAHFRSAPLLLFHSAPHALLPGCCCPSSPPARSARDCLLNVLLLGHPFTQGETHTQRSSHTTNSTQLRSCLGAHRLHRRHHQPLDCPDCVRQTRHSEGLIHPNTPPPYELALLL